MCFNIEIPLPLF